MKKNLSIFLLLILSASCSLLYGVKEQKSVDKLSINNFLIKNNYQHLPSYLADTTFRAFLKQSLQGSKYQKYFLQPLQAHYFLNDTLVSSHVNCNVEGFPKLKWNKKGHFDTFPPKTQFAATENIHFGYFEQIISKQNQSNISVDKEKYVVFVFWNLYLHKQSKILIDEVCKNAQKSKNIQIVLINNDSWFIE